MVQTQRQRDAGPPSVQPVFFWQQCTDLVLSKDPNRRTAVAMALVGTLLMAASAAVIVFLGQADVITSSEFAQMWAFLSVGGMVVMAWMVRSGWSARFRDPALTFWQMAWSITSGAVCYAFAGEARGLVPSVLAMILFFGALGLSQAQVIVIGLYAMVAFSTGVLASTRWGAAPLTFMDIAYTLMLLIVMSGTIALNLRILHIKRRRQSLRSESLALAQAVAENREVALRDGLTGLFNRRAMMELIGLEQRRNQRTKGSSVLVMLDLDRFKPINDTYGHCAGDRVLQTFAATASATMRESDVLARWGGDEFLLLLSDTTIEEGSMLIKRLGEAVTNLQVPELPSSLGLTISAGLALLLPGEPAERTIRRADEALYHAKVQGRNRFSVAEEVAVSASHGFAWPIASTPLEYENLV